MFNAISGLPCSFRAVWIFLVGVVGVGFIGQLPLQGQGPKPVMKISEEAMAVHQSGMLFDGHNDLPFAVRMKGNSSFEKLDIAKPTELHTDIARLKSGGLKAQFWSVFVPASTDVSGNALLMTLEQIQIVHDMCEKYPDTFEMADTAADVKRIVAEGKIASMIGVEGGHSIENSLQVLRNLYDRGARYMTLTHSKTLAWADSATDDPKNNGLSPFGKEVIREMNRIGMLVDLSHVSEKCMTDALDITLAPVIFSHSSAKAICDHPRNVSDKVLKMTAENGGVVMINFMSGYIVPQDVLEKNERARGDYKLVCDHIEHVINIAGIDHVGIGSDYDGVSSLPVGLDDVSYYPNITQELMNRGYDKEAIHKILGGNVMRVLEEAEIVSKKLKSGELAFPSTVKKEVQSLFAIKIDAGSVDRINSVVTATIRSETKIPSTVSLDDGQGNAMLGQVSSLDNNAYEVSFVLPKLGAGKSLTVTGSASLLNTHRSYQWANNENSDLLTMRDQSVLELMREPIDTSSEVRRAETYKPFHHVYVDNNRRLTKGPGGLFPHHRGIYFGFNRISYGDKTADTWHCTKGAYQSFEKAISHTGGPVFGADENEIHWRGNDGKPFAKEIRKLKATKIGEATLIEFDSTLTNVTDSLIKFRGDPQHAGVQIRASQEVPDFTKHLTYYIRPDGVGEPGKFRNWSNKKNESPVNLKHVDLEFNAVCLGLPKKKTDGTDEANGENKAKTKLTEADVSRYTIGYFPGVDNPSPERFSERDYARFGCYFEKDLPAGESFRVTYRFVIQPGETTLEELERLSKDLANPINSSQVDP